MTDHTTSSLAMTAKPLPLFMRITELISREIAAGHWRAGDRLPTEAELSKSLEAAVGTVRKALAELVARGMVERRQGSGTYVCEGAVAKAAGTSIYEFFRLELLHGGGLPTALVLDFQKLRHPARIPAFADGRSEHCYRLRRLRCLHHLPVALEEIWFDARHRPGLQLKDLGEALYQFYQMELGFWIARVEDHVGVGQVPSWTPSLFRLPAGSACGWVERTSWSSQGALEEVSTTWFNPALVRYTARWS
jgi:DNA-binding GntR family transcriptional regulator